MKILKKLPAVAVATVIFYLSSLPAVVVATAIFYLSSLPADDTLLQTFGFSDKLKHFIAYFVLGISCCLWVSKQKWLSKPIFYTILIGAICAVYGVTDEWHQTFVPGRSGNDLGDMAANSLGSFVSAIIYAIVIRRIPYKNTK